MCNFSRIKQDTDFTDVTLVGEGKQQITAHKVILLASSQFFKELFVQTKTPPSINLYERSSRYIFESYCEFSLSWKGYNIPGGYE